jgi:hypothetical protein
MLRQLRILQAILLTMEPAIPWVFEGWQVGPVLFAGQGFHRTASLKTFSRFARLSKGGFYESQERACPRAGQLKMKRRLAGFVSRRKWQAHHRQ